MEQVNYIQEALNRLAERLPSCSQLLLDQYAQLVFTRGRQTTNKDVHNAWSIWQNRIRPDHRSLIPFEELTVKVQELDSKYRDAIIAVADELSADEAWRIGG